METSCLQGASPPMTWGAFPAEFGRRVLWRVLYGAKQQRKRWAYEINPLAQSWACTWTWQVASINFFRHSSLEISVERLWKVQTQCRLRAPSCMGCMVAITEDIHQHCASGCLVCLFSRWEVLPATAIANRDIRIARLLAQISTCLVHFQEFEFKVQVCPPKASEQSVIFS